MPPSSPTSPAASTGRERDLSPYWNDYTKEISSRLWLPIETASPDSASNSSSGSWSATEVLSWFSINRMQAPNQNSPKIFSPSSILCLADSTDSAATGQLSKKTRVYPTREQKKTIKLWFDAARWCYNKTIETLRQPDTTANWKKIKTPIIKAIPSHLALAPYQVKSIAVRDACKAVSNAKIFNIGLKQAQTAGIRLDETFAEPGFRSRKNTKQNCFIPSQGSIPGRTLSQAAGHSQNGGDNAGDSQRLKTHPPQRQLPPLNLHPSHLRCRRPTRPPPSPRGRTRPRHQVIHDLVLRNRHRTYRQGRLWQNPTALSTPRRPYQQDRQGPTEQTPQYAESRPENAQPHPKPHTGTAPPNGKVPGRPVRPDPAAHLRNPGHVQERGTKAQKQERTLAPVPSLTTVSRGSCCGKRGRPVPRRYWSTKRIQARPAAGAEK